MVLDVARGVNWAEGDRGGRAPLAERRMNLSALILIPNLAAIFGGFGGQGMAAWSDRLASRRKLVITPAIARFPAGG